MHICMPEQNDLNMIYPLYFTFTYWCGKQTCFHSVLFCVLPGWIQFFSSLWLKIEKGGEKERKTYALLLSLFQLRPVNLPLSLLITARPQAQRSTASLLIGHLAAEGYNQKSCCVQVSWERLGDVSFLLAHTVPPLPGFDSNESIDIVVLYQCVDFQSDTYFGHIFRMRNWLPGDMLIQRLNVRGEMF